MKTRLALSLQSFSCLSSPGNSIVSMLCFINLTTFWDLPDGSVVTAFTSKPEPHLVTMEKQLLKAVPDFRCTPCLSLQLHTELDYALENTEVCKWTDVTIHSQGKDYWGKYTGLVGKELIHLVCPLVSVVKTEGGSQEMQRHQCAEEGIKCVLKT